MPRLQQTRRICAVAEQVVNNQNMTAGGLFGGEKSTSNIAQNRLGSGGTAGARQAKPGVVGFQ
jgi:hypothetical protein